MWVRPPGRSSQHAVGRYIPAVGIKHTVPAEVVIEVSRSHTMKPLHPYLPPAVIGINVLDVKCRPANANALSQIDGFMNHAFVLCIAPIDWRAVGAQYRLAIQSVSHCVIDCLVGDRIEGVTQR